MFQTVLMVFIFLLTLSLCAKGVARLMLMPERERRELPKKKPAALPPITEKQRLAINILNLERECQLISEEEYWIESNKIGKEIKLDRLKRQREEAR